MYFVATTVRRQSTYLVVPMVRNGILPTVRTVPTVGFGRIVPYIKLYRYVSYISVYTITYVQIIIIISIVEEYQSRCIGTYSRQSVTDGQFFRTDSVHSPSIVCSASSRTPKSSSLYIV